MAYRISYDSVGKYVQEKKKSRIGILAAAAVLLLVMGAVAVKSLALPWVQEVLLPGDATVTAAALEGLVDDIRNGQSMYEAITAFCQEIIKHGQYS